MNTYPLHRQSPTWAVTAGFQAHTLQAVLVRAGIARDTLVTLIDPSLLADLPPQIPSDATFEQEQAFNAARRVGVETGCELAAQFLTVQAKAA